MSQDTRKDPRAKVLTMTVRYKSATLDEFIEHHSYDVSRGGMFIKTPSPFPPGTLLKFEVKIAADQKVIQGVGRVVWKRDNETQADIRPAGMGVKFIKIDDGSRKVIDSLVESRGDATSAYEAGGGDSGNLPAPVAPPAAASSKTPAAASEAQKPPHLRKSTMIGLGSMNPSTRSAVATTPDKPAASFFPETKSEAEMPAPEDRTVMKQAAELLQDALREAGGSMAEVGSSSKQPEAPAKAAAPSAALELKRSAEPPASATATDSADTKPISEKPAPVSAKPASAKPASPKPASPKPSVTLPSARKAGAVSAAPASRRVSVPAAAPASSSAGGGGRVAVIALVLAATGGLVYAFSTGNQPPVPAPVVSAEPAPSAAPVATEAPAAEPASPTAVAVASAAPTASVAPAASASSAAPAAVVPPAVPQLPSVAVPKPAPVLQARPVAKPKPVTVAQPSTPSEPVTPSTPAPEKPASPPPAAAPLPAAPEAPAPKPVPKPAPKPKPAEPAGDNPY